MGVPLGAARADVQARLGTLQRLDLRFSSTQTTIARSGGYRYNPTTSRTLASRSGSVESLNVLVCQGFRSCSAQTRATVLRLTPTSSTSSRVDQWVSPRRSGGGLSVAARISARQSRRTLWGRPGQGWSLTPSRPRSL
jgi:hypothetical protein